MYDSAEMEYLKHIRNAGERSDADSDDTDDDSTSQTDENESDHTQKNTAEFRGSSRYQYRRDSDSGEEMGTTSSTLKNSVSIV